MIRSVFQIERAKYFPKMPKALAGPVKFLEGGKTDSVADQKEIKKLFPGTYGMPIITFEEGGKNVSSPEINVGVILSGGQAPGGHNVIAVSYTHLTLPTKRIV